jgi:hypothetical protein
MVKVGKRSESLTYPVVDSLQSSALEKRKSPSFVGSYIRRRDQGRHEATAHTLRSEGCSGTNRYLVHILHALRTQAGGVETYQHNLLLTSSMID